MGVLAILAFVALSGSEPANQSELYQAFVSWRSRSACWWEDRDRPGFARLDGASPEEVAAIQQKLCDKWKNSPGTGRNQSFREIIERTYPHTRPPGFLPREDRETWEQAVARAKAEFGADVVVETRDKNGKLENVSFRGTRRWTEDRQALKDAKDFSKTAFNRGTEPPPAPVIQRFLAIADRWPDTDSASEALDEAATLLNLVSVRAHDEEASQQSERTFKRIVVDRPDVLTEWSVFARLELACSAIGVREPVEAMLAHYEWLRGLTDQELFEKALMPMIEGGRYTSAEIESRIEKVFSALGISHSAIIENLCRRLAEGWHPQSEGILTMLMDKYRGQRMAERAEVALHKLRAKKAAAATQAVRYSPAQCPPTTQPAGKESRAGAETATPSDDSLRSYEVDIEKNRVKELTPKP
jgi:hypothetical protein